MEDLDEDDILWVYLRTAPEPLLFQMSEAFHQVRPKEQIRHSVTHWLGTNDFDWNPPDYYMSYGDIDLKKKETLMEPSIQLDLTAEDEDAEKLMKVETPSEPEVVPQKKTETKFQHNEFLNAPRWMLNLRSISFVWGFHKIHDLPVFEIPKGQILNRGQEVTMKILPIAPFSTLTQSANFQYPDLEDQYIVLEKNMLSFYDKIDYRRRPIFPANMLQEGNMVVYYDCGVRCLRAKVMDIPNLVWKTEKWKQVKVYLVDWGITLNVGCGNVLFLYSKFAKLPPRAIQLNMYGMEYYKHLNSYRRLAHPDSEIWDGPLNVFVPKSLKQGVLIFSKMIPKQLFPFGISEFIVRRLSLELPPPISTHIGQEVTCWIVHAENDGKLFVQFDTPFYHHIDAFLKKKFILQKYRPGQGLEMAYLENKIVLAPQEGYYYRAVLEDLPTSPVKPVKVKFVDYGNSMEVPRMKIVVAGVINPFYDIIPHLVQVVQLSEMDGETQELQALNQFLEFESVQMKVVGSTLEGLPKVELRQYYEKALGENQDTTLENFMEVMSFSGKHLKSNESSSVKVCRNESADGCIDDMYDNNKVVFDILPNNDGSISRILRPGAVVLFRIANLDPIGETICVFPDYILHRLNKLQKDLAKAFEKREFNKNWRFFCRDIRQLHKGMFLMVRSACMNCITRGMMIRPTRNKEYHADILLIDYCMMESIPIEKLAYLSYSYTLFPAYGTYCSLLIPDPVKKDEFLSYDFKNFTILDGLDTNWMIVAKILQVATHDGIRAASLQFLDKLQLPVKSEELSQVKEKYQLM